MSNGFPASIDMERAVLGSVLLRSDAISEIDTLQANDFYDEQHSWIYDAMLACAKRGERCTTGTVSEELRRRNKLDAIGGIPALSDLAATCPGPFAVVDYAKAVERTAGMRRLIEVGGTIAGIGYDEMNEFEEALAKAEAELAAIRRTKSSGIVPLSEVVDEYFSFVESVKDNDGSLLGISTGYRDLDGITNGFQKSDFIIIAARPSVGKTSLVLSIVYNAAQQGVPIGIFSLEMSRDQLVKRIISMDTGLDGHLIQKGKFDSTQATCVMKSLGKMDKLPVFIDDTSGLSIHEVRSKARRMVADYGVQVIFIDYIQLMGGKPGGDNQRNQEVSEISRGIKAMARELDIPIVAISQLSRAVEGRSSHVPMLSDLRESGSLEQDADIVMFIYREELYEKETDKKGVAEIHISKHRNGPIGVIPMRFDGPTTRFSDLTYRQFDEFDVSQPPRYDAALEDDLFG